MQKKAKYTMQSNHVTLSKINLSNIYEKRLLNAFIDSLAPYLKSKFENAKNINRGLHINEQHEFEFDENKSIVFTYNLSDVEPNHQNYDRLRSAIKKLRKTDIDIVTPDGTEIYTGLIEMAVLNPRSEFFKVKLSLTAYQFLCDVSKGYSLKSFKTSLELKTLYSSYMYDLICKWRNRPTFQIDIEELRFITNTENKYPATKDFKKRVLDSAKKELDESDITDLTFNYEDVKKGRSIVGFKIHIFHTKNDILKRNKIIKKVSPNWDFTKPVLEYLNENEINFNGANREVLKEFFKINGTEKGLDFLEKTKLNALQKSRDNVQGYTMSAVKKHIEQKTNKTSKQYDILTQISETKKV